jgi:hypothetical protein
MYSYDEILKMADRMHEAAAKRARHTTENGSATEIATESGSAAESATESATESGSAGAGATESGSAGDGLTDMPKPVFRGEPCYMCVILQATVNASQVFADISESFTNDPRLATSILYPEYQSANKAYVDCQLGQNFMSTLTPLLGAQRRGHITGNDMAFMLEKFIQEFQETDMRQGEIILKPGTFENVQVLSFERPVTTRRNPFTAQAHPDKAKKDLYENYGKHLMKLLDCAYGLRYVDHRIPRRA